MVGEDDLAVDPGRYAIGDGEERPDEPVQAVERVEARNEIDVGVRPRIGLAREMLPHQAAVDTRQTEKIG